MSGGSFNYVCYKLVADPFSAMGDLIEMESFLRAVGKLKAAEKIEKAINELEVLQLQAIQISNRMYALTHAVEWWVSADGDEEDIQEALEKMDDC